MRRDIIAALRHCLDKHLSMRKSRLESFCVLVVGVLLSRTVNLSHLAGMFPTRAEIASNYRRLQRFFEQVELDSDQLARVVVRIARIGSGPWLLALDRTSWKFGRRDVNVLMLAIVHNGIAIPLMWDVLDRAGNSTTAHREALLSRFCNVFGAEAVAGLIADREFVGTAWMAFLVENNIPFILRIKDAFQIRLADGRCCPVVSLFRKLAIGGRRYVREDCRLGSRGSALGPPVKLAATRLASKELLVVATNTDPGIALANYRRRWEIETLFAASKTRGLNLEDTHITNPERIAKLIAVLAVAFTFAHTTGEWSARHRPIIIKTHKRKAKSIFRVGFDLLRKILIQGGREAVQCWNAIMTGQPPNPQGPRAGPHPA
ncbi:IS4 family transposase [Xanthobacter sp. AM11]|uniref:IS4 family transposase n=1 Tax=Xanthobacter sp. AM11 TaxID=3380643 RepID=UPI0039BF8AD9